MFAAGLAIGGVLLWVVLRSVDMAAARRAFATTDPGWVVLGIAAFALGLGLRTWRWHRLVAYLGPVSLRRVGEALITGYAINNIVPARLGELYRADRLGRGNALPRSAVLGTIFLERLLDLALVVSLLAVGFLLVERQSSAIGATLATAGATIALALAATVMGLWLARSTLLPWLLERSTSSDTLPRRATRRVLGWAEGFSKSLNLLSTRNFAVAALVTVPIWAIESAAIFAILRSIGVQVGIAGLMLAVAAGSLSTLIPSAPGFLGSYQFAYVIALELVGIDATLAAVAGTSVVLYLIGSVTVLGLVLLAADGLRGLRAAPTP